MSGINFSNVTVTRLLLLREVERHFGQRDFRISQLQELNAIHASDCLHPQMAINGGWIDRVSRGRYKISQRGWDLLKYIKTTLN